MSGTATKRLPKGTLKGCFWGTMILILGIKTPVVAASLNRTTNNQPLSPTAITIIAAVSAAVVLNLIARRFPNSHFNPALSLALAITGDIGWSELPRRWFAQLSGAIVGCLLLWGIFGSAGRHNALLGASQPVAGFASSAVNIVEFLGVYFFCSSVIFYSRKEDELAFGEKEASIGKALGMGILFAGTVSGGALNPAIGFAPLLVTWHFTGWFSYVFASLAGGLLAGLTHRPRKSQADRDKLRAERRARIAARS